MLKKQWKQFFVIALLLFITAGCGNNKENKQGATGSTPAYAFKLTTLEGKTVTLDDYKGKALILDIWDTWCPPCKAEIPDFIALYDEYNDKGLEILGAAIGREGTQAVANFAKQYKINYPNAIITPDFIPGVGGVSGIPTTFVIDKKGNVYKKHVGRTPKQVFENDIKAILGL